MTKAKRKLLVAADLADDPEIKAAAEHTRRWEQAQDAARKAREPYQRELERFTVEDLKTPAGSEHFDRLKKDEQAAVRKAYADHGFTEKPPEVIDTPAKQRADRDRRVDMMKRNRKAWGCEGTESDYGELTSSVQVLLLYSMTSTPTKAADLCRKAGVPHNSHARAALSELHRHGYCNLKYGHGGGYWTA